MCIKVFQYANKNQQLHIDIYGYIVLRILNCLHAVVLVTLVPAAQSNAVFG